MTFQPYPRIPRSDPHVIGYLRHSNGENSETRFQVDIQIGKQKYRALVTPGIVEMLNFPDPAVRQVGVNYVLKEVGNKEKNQGPGGKEEPKKKEKKENAPEEIRKETKEEQAKRDETTEQQFHYWTEKEEKLLVETRSSMEEEFSSTKSHNTLWHKLTKILSDNSVIVTCKQAQDKWKTLKKKYKEVEDNNNKSGRERQTCKFYNIFSNLYGTKPSTKPLCVIDTDNGDLSESPKKPPQKRIKPNESKSPKQKIIEMMRETATKNEEELRQHHEQKLVRFDRFLDLFEQSIKKKE